MARGFLVLDYRCLCLFSDLRGSVEVQTTAREISLSVIDINIHDEEDVKGEKFFPFTFLDGVIW